MGIEYQVTEGSAKSLNAVSEDKNSRVKQLTTEKLFDNANEILILHAGENYLLTITKQKKLLLTKVKHGFR
jgi:hemin uptake protein HemP